MTRTALFLALICCACSVFAQEKKEITANEVVERIKKNLGVPWNEQTVDTFKSGDPNGRVTGIAITMMATLDVLQRAAAQGDNLIITHEPTFYDHTDALRELPMGESDPVLAEKRKFIADHHLIIWRFHDHWHRNTRDGILAGQVHALGWENCEDKANPYLFTIPETTVERLSDDIQKRLRIHVMRVVGDRDMKVKRVAFSPGASGFRREVGALEMPDVDVLLAGEPREWETVEYVADAIAEGRHKALIILSHVPSEQFGMDECAQWLKTFVTEVPIEFVPTKDPFAPLKPPQK